MRRWTTTRGKAAATAKADDRLAAALSHGERVRERCWCGAIVLLGPIVSGRTLGVNLYMEPGEARFRVVDENGRETRMSRGAIIRRIKTRLARLSIPE